MRLEAMDPHTSVTFVSLAATGATISHLIDTPHKDAADEYDVILLPQLKDLWSIVGDREIDALTIAIGGNDIGFSEIIEKLVTNPFFRDEPAGLDMDDWHRYLRLQEAFTELRPEQCLHACRDQHAAPPPMAMTRSREAGSSPGR